jgi:guanylate kinase
MRPNEEDGREYFFVARDEFLRMRDAGDLAEWAEVHGALYGSPRRYLDAELARGFIVVLDIDVQGGLSIKERYPDAVLIFILPPSPAVLEARLRGRGTDADAVIARRMAAAPKEIACAPRYDYVVVNGDFETALARVRDIVGAERSRRERCYRPEGRALPEERRSIS